MLKCPHCNEFGINAWAKWKAGTAIPAICQYCGKASSINGNILGASGGIFHFLFLIFAFAAFYYWSWWPLIGYCLLFITVDAMIVKWVSLKALSEDQVKKSRRNFYVFILIFILLVVVAGLLGN